jgi:hypothetical protein
MFRELTNSPPKGRLKEKNMSINMNWADSYSPAEATRGQFLPIDTTSLGTLGYPITGRGKYAVLTYDLNAATATTSGTMVSVGNATQVSAITLLSAVPQTVTFNPKVNSIEVYNNDSVGTVYLSWTALSMAALSSTGLPIIAGAYYSIDRSINSITLGSMSNINNLRVFGHYGV